MRWPAVIGVAALAACGENQTLVAARHSAYNADRKFVVDEIAAYLRERRWGNSSYAGDELEVDEAAGTVSTAWHLMYSNQPTAKHQVTPMLVQGDYVRFDIEVTDGPPWHVNVVSHGGRMMEGAHLMTEVAPDQQDMIAETNRVIADIYRRLERYAVPVEP